MESNLNLYSRRLVAQGLISTHILYHTIPSTKHPGEECLKTMREKGKCILTNMFLYHEPPRWPSG